MLIIVLGVEIELVAASSLALPFSRAETKRPKKDGRDGRDGKDRKDGNDRRDLNGVCRCMLTFLLAFVLVLVIE